jgi:glycosyltransferase involved in cell wall biosynthesis
VIAQAAAAGVPMICARDGGHTDWLPQDAALFVDPTDPSEIAEAIDSVFSNYDAARARALLARARAYPLREDVCYLPLKKWLKGLVDHGDAHADNSIGRATGGPIESPDWREHEHASD